MTLLLLAAAVSLGALAARAPSVLLSVPLLLLAGFFANGLVQLGHEAWHGNLFRARLPNALFGHLFSLLSLVPFRSARDAHLRHHRYNRTARDPDAYNVGADGLLVRAQFYVVVTLGLALAPLHFGVLYPAVFMRGRALVGHVVELTVNALVWFALFRYVLVPNGWARPLVELWVLPFLFATPWNGLKSIADHYANRWEGDRFHTATTVRTTALWTFLWSGLNHHLDHHLYPRVPGHHLPRLHEHLRGALARRDAPVFDGYLRVFWRAFVAGPTYVSDGHAFLKAPPR
jgi:fatty acid desaturase